MKRLTKTERFLFRPGVFFNQLQWSSSHWIIMLSFLGIAAVETHLGPYSELYLNASQYFQAAFGLSATLALWAVTASKLVIMVVGAYLMAMFIWLVGNLIGKKRSQRVLFRRLAIVFTILLLGRTAAHLVYLNPALEYVSMGLYLWGAILGFFAVREQFILSSLETVAVGLIAVLMFFTSMHLSKQVSANLSDQLAKASFEAETAIPGVANKPKKGQNR